MSIRKYQVQIKEFSLIELLIVFAMLGILMSLLLPSLRKTMESATQINCLSQTKQLVLVTNFYVEENEKLPQMYWDKVAIKWQPTKNGPGYRGELDPYIEDLSIWGCPARPTHHPDLAELSLFNSKLNKWQSHFIYNIYVNNKHPREIPTPRKQIVFIESRSYGVSGIDGPTFVWPNDYQSNSKLRVGFPHSEVSSNAFFVDGHAESLIRGSVLSNFFYPNWTP